MESPVGRAELVASRALVALASLGFALAAGWELAGPLPAGHFATDASIGIAAENMLRWHILGPVLNYTSASPAAASTYSHHPWGIYWTELPFVALLGHSALACRLPPLLLSAATPPLLYLTGRTLWRPAAGAAAALSFAVLPITLSFAQFNALEVPVIAWGLLATWGYVRAAQGGPRRFVVISTGGALAAMNADWPAFLLVGGLVGAGVLLTPLRGPRGFEPLERRQVLQWAWWLGAAVVVAVFYVLVFHHLDTWSDLLASYDVRSKGHERSLESVLERRRYWNELCFTPIAIALGKVALPVVVARLVVRRREHEVVPLVWLLLATVQYLLFWQGAEVHVFWPHYFAVYFALAMGALVATGASLGAPPSWAWALALVTLPLAAILRDGLPALVYARATGGRFNEKGLIIDSDGSKMAFLRFIEPRLLPGEPVEMHPGMKATWSQMWELGGREVVGDRDPPLAGATASDGHDVYLLDTRLVPDELQAALARGFHVVAAGPFWMVRKSEPPAPIDAYAIEETEPSGWQWYLSSGTEPQRTVAADAYLTWELRTHFGQVATAPSEPPRTFSQRRIAHNLAVAAGDTELVRHLADDLRLELTPAEVRLGPGLELVGTRYHPGVSPELTLLLRCTGDPPDEQLRVRSEVLAPARYSTTMADPTVREIALPLGLAPRRFRPGFLYEDDIPIRKRPGTESFRAMPGTIPSPPRREPLDRGSSFEVLQLE